MPPKNANVWLRRRAAQRRQLGPLLHQKISNLTRKRYNKSCQWFLWWLQMQGLCISSETHLDFVVQDYIEELWNCNAGLDCAQNTVAGILHFMRHSVRLHGAWRLLNTWKRAEPPARAPPIPEVVLHAAAMQALLDGDASMAVSLLIFFHAFIRTGELLLLQTSHMFVDHVGNVVLALGRTKSGKRKGEDEYAILDAEPIASIVTHYLRMHPGVQPIIGREPHRWRKDFDLLLQKVGVAFLQYRPYSLRRGGATNALMEGMTLSVACDRGRWAQGKRHECTSRKQPRF